MEALVHLYLIMMGFYGGFIVNKKEQEDNSSAAVHIF